MSALSLRLPKSLHEQLKELAQEDGISVNQFVMLAVAEKIASISTIEYLQKRAKRGSRENLLGCEGAQHQFPRKNRGDLPKMRDDETPSERG
jgi:hypothetical protein